MVHASIVEATSACAQLQALQQELALHAGVALAASTISCTLCLTIELRSFFCLLCPLFFLGLEVCPPLMDRCTAVPGCRQLVCRLAADTCWMLIAKHACVQSSCQFCCLV